jgi:hypothetical protein
MRTSLSLWHWKRGSLEVWWRSTLIAAHEHLPPSYLTVCSQPQLVVDFYSPIYGMTSLTTTGTQKKMKQSCTMKSTWKRKGKGVEGARISLNWR